MHILITGGCGYTGTLLTNNLIDLGYNVLHSLRFFDLKKAIHEINRVVKQAYIVVESYRNEEELVNLQCWNTVGQCFFDVDEWIYLFNEFGYKGDYEFIFFE